MHLVQLRERGPTLMLWMNGPGKNENWLKGPDTSRARRDFAL